MPLLGRWVLCRLSHSVFFLLPHVHLSFLPGFRAKPVSEANILPRSLVIRSLTDLSVSLAWSFSLCPVWALRIFLRRTSSLTPRPLSFFVSPQSPSRPLSTNALSFSFRWFFLRLRLLPLPLFRLLFCSAGCSLRRVTASAFFTPVFFSPQCLGVRLLVVDLCLSFFFSLSEVPFSSSVGFGLVLFVAASSVLS